MKEKDSPAQANPSPLTDSRLLAHWQKYSQPVTYLIPALTCNKMLPSNGAKPPDEEKKTPPDALQIRGLGPMPEGRTNVPTPRF